MSKLRVLDLFAGIGGFSLGLERTGGFETVAFCEIEDYPCKVLAKHWPNVPIYNDVRELTGDRLRADGITVDVITGGFPCQDISTAGRQAGIGEGTRSGLWSECARLLGDVRPRLAIFENVTALLSGNGGDWFKRVLWDISKVGYDAEWHCIPASELGAHHHRDRAWIVAYPNREREPKSGYRKKTHGWEANRSFGTCKNVSNAHIQGLQGSKEQGIISFGWQGWEEFSARCLRDFGKVSEIEPTICRGADGIPGYAHRIKSLGNAVVPQIPELIGRAILEAEHAA